MYKSKKEIAKRFRISERTVDRRISEMISCPRYPKSAILKLPGMVRIDEDAFLDYLINKPLIDDGEMKHLSPFRGGEVI